MGGRGGAGTGAKALGTALSSGWAGGGVKALTSPPNTHTRTQGRPPPPGAWACPRGQHGVRRGPGRPPRASARLTVRASVLSFVLQLQKLKRSLSFKTKSLRSKSADNFFQRSSSDVRLQGDTPAEGSPRASPRPAPGSLTSTPTRAGPHPGSSKAHAFQEHIFKKPTFCDVCNHMIVGKAAPGPPRNPGQRVQALCCRAVHAGGPLGGVGGPQL